MRLRMPARLSFVSLVLWALRVAVVVFVVMGSAATIIDGRFGLDDWQNLIVYGVAQGSVYALIALGYTLVYGVLFMINFAHGDVFMVGAFTGFFVADALDDAGMIDANPIVALLITTLAAMVVAMILAILLERIAYRPLRRAPRLVPLITAIGASLFISNSVRGLIDARVHAYPRVDILEGRSNILGISILKTQAVVIVAAILLMIGLYYFVQHTRTGRAMR
ncbi:MAG TPA: branched-chain amino acid ABC transporter permease, partial [Vicinamibacterales bacterium]|nr:branched-chain amino acid ABC transporter permease [Vicinamibacterales bacterium]